MVKLWKKRGARSGADDAGQMTDWNLEMVGPVGSWRRVPNRGDELSATLEAAHDLRGAARDFLNAPCPLLASSFFPNRHADRVQQRHIPPLRSAVSPLCTRAVSWGKTRANRADIRGAIRREKIPPESRIGAPGLVTPHALSKSGVYSESLIIKTGLTECMRCDR